MGVYTSRMPGTCKQVCKIHEDYDTKGVIIGKEEAKQVQAQLGTEGYWRVPSLFHLTASDTALR